MSDYFQCELPYPYFARVWNGYERERYFSIIIDSDSKLGRYLDHNGQLWDKASKIDALDLLNPIKNLEGNGRYEYLTVPPQEKDFR